MRNVLRYVPICLLVAAPTFAQQQPLPQPAAENGQRPSVQGQTAPEQTGPAQTPPGFQLNQLEQAFLDQVLTAWQQKSGEIRTFRCTFDRWEYNAAFGPGQNIPLNKDKGDITYSAPDKGSFQITEIHTWQAKPIPPGEQPPAQTQGDWVKQPDAIGEHWACDGQNIYEYRHDQKQVVQRPLPENMRGKAIADGPLPFLFGTDANRLKQQYWLRVQQQANPQEIWILAQPKFQEQAANFKAVEVILDRQAVLPKAMQVYLPDNSRHVYMFDLAHATKNGTLDKIRNLFQLPQPLGWKRVIEEVPIQQAAQPVQRPR